jgi:carbon-monoxide dehydrogenase large subunit
LFNRREDHHLIRGSGQFIDDLHSPDCCHAFFYRSQISVGFIKDIKIDAALKMPGVIDIFTGHDLSDLCVPKFNDLIKSNKNIDFPVLSAKKITHVGQPLAIVIAKSYFEAQNASEMIEIEIDGSISSTIREENDPLFSIYFKKSSSETEMDQCEVSTSLKMPRVIALTLEPRSILSRYVRETDSFHISLGSQTPSRAQVDFANALNLPVDKVRVSMQNVGGAFGFKSSLYPEELIVAWATKRLRRSIKWVSSRSEDFLTGMHGRGMSIKGSVKFSNDGMLKGLIANVVCDLGAWLPFSAVVPLRNATRILPGPYLVSNIDISGQAYLSHSAPVNIYRGAGRPEAAILMEILMDKAAQLCKVDVVDFRLNNLISKDEMPFKTPTGETFDSGDYSKILLTARELFDYEKERELQAARRHQNEWVGIGVAFYIEPCGMGWESASIELRADNTIQLYCGSPAQGQGHETTFANIAAKELQCSPSLITVKLGDTDFGPPGLGALASRSTSIGGSAIVKVCREALRRKNKGEALPIFVSDTFHSEEAWSCGCVMTRLTIDADTGKTSIEKLVFVDDAGIQIDPELVKDQLMGGCAQGIGQAMMERIVYDENGQLLTGSLMDYAIPRADDIPYIQVHSEHTPSPNNLLGTKGVGEAGCIGVPASLLNAARDALGLSVDEDIDFPLTSEKLWKFLMQKKRKE